MLRLLASFLFFASLLLAASTKTELDSAKKNLYSSSKSNLFKAYDTYKRHYLKALINGDIKTQKRCLNGIVIAGEKLHIDVDEYEKKLAVVESEMARNPSTKKTVDEKSAVSQATKTEKIKQEKVKEKKVKIRSQHALSGFTWEGSSLVLDFDFTLKKSDINYFKLRPEGKKGYRYIFDVHAIVHKKPVIKHKEIKRITISQYKRDTIRIVIESQNALNPRFRYEGNSLVINLGVSKVYAPKAKQMPRVTKKDKLIIIDPGHGGRDGGAVGYKGHLEKDIVLQISNRLAKVLRNQGYKVRMTRDTDKTLTLKWRTKFTRKNNPDLFISIHANSVPKKKASKASGIEIYYLDPKKGSKRSSRLERQENSADYKAMDRSFSELLSATQSRIKVRESNFLAIDLGQNVVSRLREKRFKVKDAKVAGGNFWVLVGATSAATLVEVGFVSHPKEVQLLINKRYQQAFAEGLADGVEQYFINKERR
ncbi:N-acetylmuramoyl-L-alanine amidase [Sulfurimonas sp. HSL3-7]|uniref:N-acetylmuramoyl-L-alanine amidase family protein n=1 Tax=Sulfonitrofixus jiaomeiensis TaxID=3131938 RepID=UPI0031F7E5D7